MCKECGTALAPDASFCGQCGAPVTRPTTETSEAANTEAAVSAPAATNMADPVPTSVPDPAAMPVAETSARVAPGIDRVSFITLGASLVVIVGAFLPWVTVGGWLSVSGTSGDGSITLVAGILAGIFGFIMRKRNTVMPFTIGILGLVAVAVSGYDMSEVSNLDPADSESLLLAKASIGSGMYLTFIGGLGLIAAAVMGRRELKRA